MLSLAKEHMSVFRRGRPELFQQLYPISEELRASADIEETWFEHIGDVLSHPYDPLLIMLLCEPAVFVPHLHGRHTLVGNTKDGKAGVMQSEAHDALVMRVRQTLAYCTSSARGVDAACEGKEAVGESHSRKKHKS